MTFGEQLRRARESRAQSRAELGAMIGVSDETIRRWELGDNEPRAARIARALDAELGTAFEFQLFGSEPPAEPDDLSEAEAADMLAEVERLAERVRSLESRLRADPRGHSLPLDGPRSPRRGYRQFVSTS